MVVEYGYKDSCFSETRRVCDVLREYTHHQYAPRYMCIMSPRDDDSSRYRLITLESTIEFS